MENLENEKHEIPKDFLNSCYLTRTGKIFTNLLIVCCIIILCSFITPILTILSYVIGIMLIFVTLGTIFVYIPDYWQRFTSFMSDSSAFVGNLVNVIPYIMGVSIAISILAIVFLSLDKKNKSKGRLAFCIVAGIVIIISLVIYLVGGLA